jgi:hypothetical protein
MGLAVVLIILGISSVFAGGMATRRATKTHFGEISELTLNLAKSQGLLPKYSPALVVLGWLAALVGAGIALFG